MCRSETYVVLWMLLAILQENIYVSINNKMTEIINEHMKL